MEIRRSHFINSFKFFRMTPEIQEIKDEFKAALKDVFVKRYGYAEKMIMHRPHGIGYFYVTSSDIDYGTNLDGLVHHILFDTDLYKRFLTPKEYKEMKNWKSLNLIIAYKPRYKLSKDIVAEMRRVAELSVMAWFFGPLN